MFSQIGKFFFPSGDSTSKPAGTFTSAAASSAGLPAAAAPILKNKKANSTRSSSLPSLPSFSSNLKQGVNYADPSDEEVYDLKISKPKFNAGDPNPFFVNVPAKKYKVLVSDDLEVEPTEEITNSTLRFYGSSAENVYKKAKTYKTSAKSKHNTIFQKARENHRTRAIKNIRNKAQAGREASKQTNLQMQKFRQSIQKITLELNDYLEKYALAKKGYIPATAFKKSSTMTPEFQKREIKRLEGLMNTAVSLLNEIKGEIEKVPNLPIDIQTSLEKALSQGAKAAAIAKAPNVSQPLSNPMYAHSASTEGSAVASAQGQSKPQNKGKPSPPSLNAFASGKRPSAGRERSGSANSRASAAGTGAGAAGPRPQLNPEALKFISKLKAADAAKKAGVAGSGAGAAGAASAASGAAGTASPASNGNQTPTGFARSPGGTLTQIGETGAGASAAAAARAVAAAGANASNPPSPIKIPATGEAVNASVPTPVAAAAPPAPGQQGGSRKRRHQKKRKARTAKRKTGKSRKN